MITKQHLPHQDKGMRLAQARKLLKYTQTELSNVTGVSFGSISAYERGVNLPKLEAIQKLQKAGINMEYVLEGIGEPLISSADTILKKQLFESSHNPTSVLPSIREDSPGYNINTVGGSINDMESYLSSKKDALKQVDELLAKLKFDTAHTLLKHTIAELLQHEQITTGAAQALLIIMRDDYLLYQEQLAKLPHKK